jgi:hypothetical protein
MPIYAPETIVVSPVMPLGVIRGCTTQNSVSARSLGSASRRIVAVTTTREPSEFSPIPVTRPSSTFL